MAKKKSTKKIFEMQTEVDALSASTDVNPMQNEVEENSSNDEQTEIDINDSIKPIFADTEFDKVQNEAVDKLEKYILEIEDLKLKNKELVETNEKLLFKINELNALLADLRHKSTRQPVVNKNINSSKKVELPQHRKVIYNSYYKNNGYQTW